MNRRKALITIGGGGVLGGGILFGGVLYGSSDLRIESTNDGSTVHQDGKQIGSLSHSVTPITDDNALLGISLPDRATVQKVAVEVVWAIRRNGLWSDITVDLVSTGAVKTRLQSGVATAYRSPWGDSTSEADDSAASQRRFEFPLGTTAGRVDGLLTALESTDSEEKVVELEATLSARSLGGTRIELTAPAELTYSLD